MFYPIVNNNTFSLKAIVNSPTEESALDFFNSHFKYVEGEHSVTTFLDKYLDIIAQLVGFMSIEEANDFMMPDEEMMIIVPQRKMNDMGEAIVYKYFQYLHEIGVEVYDYDNVLEWVYKVNYLANILPFGEDIVLYMPEHEGKPSFEELCIPHQYFSYSTQGIVITNQDSIIVDIKRSIERLKGSILYGSAPNEITKLEDLFNLLLEEMEGQH